MNNDMELFCVQCFASESSGSWVHVVVGSFCTNCCGNGTTMPLPKAAIESIRQQASWVGKRYYPHAEDLAKVAVPQPSIDLATIREVIAVLREDEVAAEEHEQLADKLASALQENAK